VPTSVVDDRPVATRRRGLYILVARHRAMAGSGL